MWIMNSSAQYTEPDFIGKSEAWDNILVNIRFFVGPFQRTRPNYYHGQKIGLNLWIFNGVTFGAHGPFFFKGIALWPKQARSHNWIALLLRIFNRLVGAHDLIFYGRQIVG